MGTWIQVLLFLAVTGYLGGLAVKAALHRFAYMKLGKNNESRAETKGGTRRFFMQVFGQSKLLKDRKSGIMHIIIFYGFIMLQFGALDIIYKGLTGRRLPVPGYDFFVLSQEITVICVLAAVGYAVYRRYGEKLPRLKRGWAPSLVSWFIAALMLSVVMTTAFERIAAGVPPSVFAPVSSVLAGVFGSGMPHSAARFLYLFFWWLHLVILLAFALYVPQSKHFHLVTAPLNLWLKRGRSPGALRPMDLEDEEAESFGAGKIEHFEQQQLLDLYACVECGRCTEACPAAGTGKLLSPMHMMTKLRDHLTEKGASLTAKSPWLPAYLFADAKAHVFRGDAAAGVASEPFGPNIVDIGPTLERQQKGWVKTDKDVREIELIGEVMSEEEIWACTSCRSCEEMCPVGNSHVDKIMDMRRYLVLTEGKSPQDAQRAMRNIERQGNPWGISRNERADWMKELEDAAVPIAAETDDFELLLFVGSMGSFDNRSMKVTRALVRLLQEAGVSFAVLGNEERNSGDTPRRLGNELLFQELCRANIETFRKYNVKKIVTACPHTFNTFKNEYPAFGLEAEVLHHTQLLAQLVKEGRLVPKYAVNERIVYHDSCYLGRYNGVYDEPRDLLRAIPGAELAEMDRSFEKSMCCGAGGGLMWMEEGAGKRINTARFEQAMEVRPDIIGSACPYCLAMMEDGAKQKGAENRIEARDVAEILWQSVHGPEGD